MTTCPHCASTDCSSNKFPSVAVNQLTDGAILAVRERRTADALSSAVLWLGIAFANRFRHAWRCNRCSRTFEQ